jgi:hypothetical protein
MFATQPDFVIVSCHLRCTAPKNLPPYLGRSVKEVPDRGLAAGKTVWEAEAVGGGGGV